MKLKNTTNVPESLLREVIRFVFPGPVTNYSIWFKRAGGGKRVFFAGRAYTGRKHVVCRIPVWHKLAEPYRGAASFERHAGKGDLLWLSETYEESLVALVAHELNHLHQAKSPRLYRRTPYARGRFSEVDCDTYANEMVLAWRAAHGPETKAPVLVPRDLSKPKPLTPRQRLEAMAAPLGIDIDWGSPSPDCIWVPAPSGLLDADGVMEGDPYENGHTHYCYAEAKEAILAYAKICLDRGVKPVNLIA